MVAFLPHPLPRSNGAREDRLQLSHGSLESCLGLAGASNLSSISSLFQGWGCCHEGLWSAYPGQRAGPNC